MANSQLYPQSTYPFSGDVLSGAGNPAVRVVGIQTIPVSSVAPENGQVLQFDSSVSEYVPNDIPANRSVQINAISMSDDYDFFVGFVDVTVQVNSPFAPNGNPVLINGAW